MGERIDGQADERTSERKEGAADGRKDEQTGGQWSTLLDSDSQMDREGARARAEMTAELEELLVLEAMAVFEAAGTVKERSSVR